MLQLYRVVILIRLLELIKDDLGLLEELVIGLVRLIFSIFNNHINFHHCFVLVLGLFIMLSLIWVT